MLDADPGAIVAAASSSDVPHHFTADVAMLDLAVTALGLAQPPGAPRIPYAGLREHYVPEWQFHGKAAHRDRSPAASLIITVSTWRA